jgi:hypothetical protein
MIRTHHNPQLFELAASWTMLLSSSGIWAYNTLQFLHGIVG